MQGSGSAHPDGGGAGQARQGAGDGALFGLTWAHFLNDGVSNYLPGILPALLVSLHEPVRLAGLLVAALWVGQAAQPLTGWVADLMGGRSLLVAGLLTTSAGGALLGMAGATWVLVLLLVLIGLGSALFHPQALAAVRSLLRSRRGFLTSAFLVGGELGRGVSPTVASLIAAAFGLRSLWIVAVPALATVPLLLLWAPRLPPSRRRTPPIRWRVHAYPMAVLTGYAGVRAFTAFGLVTFIPIMWHLRGGTLVGGASIITTMLVVGVAGNLGGGYLADRCGRRPVLLASSIATCALVPPVVYAHGYWVWIAAALLGVAMFLGVSATILIGQDVFPENPSMGSGIALGLANAIGALLVLAVGLRMNEHDAAPVFWVFAAAALVTAPLALAFPRRLMRRAAVPAGRGDAGRNRRAG